MALGTAVMVAGYAVRVSGTRGFHAGALSMENPLSVPQLYVAGLLAAAAMAAFAGASRQPARRSWWTAVGLVTGVLAAGKAAGVIRASEARAVEEPFGPLATVGLGVVLLAATSGLLWFFGHGERRDTNRVIAALATYGAATAGLYAATSPVLLPSGGIWAASASLVQGTAEIAAAVMCMLAVLFGVAPRLVMPRSWVLRRQADAASLDAPDLLAGRSGAAQGPSAVR